MNLLGALDCGFRGEPKNSCRNWLRSSNFSSFANLLVIRGEEYMYEEILVYSGSKGDQPKIRKTKTSSNVPYH